MTVFFLLKSVLQYLLSLLDSEELELSGSFYVGGLDYMDPNLGSYDEQKLGLSYNKRQTLNMNFTFVQDEKQICQIVWE